MMEEDVFIADGEPTFTKKPTKLNLTINKKTPEYEPKACPPELFNKPKEESKPKEEPKPTPKTNG